VSLEQVEKKEGLSQQHCLEMVQQAPAVAKHYLQERVICKRQASLSMKVDFYDKTNVTSTVC